ncbi:MAG: bifunctional 5,10-methylene-tetrahydrofolate dehydrogenase/5,10-methylene-tetrahydrofolate cyclohydrolase [Deltaproteobacteria bacterium RIFCSPHIGHO2_02_FULL_40_11]|nr:MAG: bifunctional 5,10-methylene-tetrahydrofolate dehydrogenase/5,10-methylene-tetrahydrofolate cyclohydrolase [Deltaproteobacteria bacterium RIFCSPHIGHO2_02_FULL_40_11]
MKILDGSSLSKKIRETLRKKLSKISGPKPGLAVILVGSDPASEIYVSKKEKLAKEVGFHSEVHRLPKDTSQNDLLKCIETLNGAQNIHGILVQMPLPKHIDTQAILHAVLPNKDVDGFHPTNLGRLMMGHPRFVPCTPAGILRLLKEYQVEISGKKAVILGRSLIVGKPLAHLLLNENATVTLCHSKTKNLKAECQSADILISAMGKPAHIDASFIKEGAVVIDVGINRMNQKIIGDIDFNSVSKKASFITPVPGGIGPMTIAMLLENTLKAFEIK